MSGDTLSDVLHTVRLKGAVFFTVDATSPWVAESDDAPVVLSRVMPDAQHLISYHVVTEGTCFGRLVDGEARRLEPGDVIVFPHGDRHVMSSAPGLRSVAGPEDYPRPPHPQLPFQMKVGGGGPERCLVVCGFLGCDARPFNPLLANLPRVLHVSAKQGGGDGRLRQFCELVVAESRTRRAGGESVLAKLSELMFVEVVRRHLEALPPEQTGWLSGLRDPFVGRALAKLHERPAEPWTVERLARDVGMSRSVLAERFTHFLGQPPMQYLAQWRMQIAAGLLQRGGQKLAAVALAVGYDSEEAFSRAFKKLAGVAPRSWARARAATTAAATSPRAATVTPPPARRASRPPRGR
jgi:AraC-like DNA-binding protein